jgi:hypothetical protein
MIVLLRLLGLEARVQKVAYGEEGGHDDQADPQPDVAEPHVGRVERMGLRVKMAFAEGVC